MTGYGEYIERFLKILETAGFRQKEINSFVRRLNLEVDPMEYEVEMMKAIIKKIGLVYDQMSVAELNDVYNLADKAILRDEDCEKLINWIQQYRLAQKP